MLSACVAERARYGIGMETKQLILGTHNVHKGKELAEMLAPHGVAVATLAKFPEAIVPVEDGKSFAENAQIKAIAQAKHLHQWVLADDSGIAIDALKGAPGIDSAHFAGDARDDEANNRLVLEKLADVPPERRGAKYICHVVLANPTGQVVAEATGFCKGRIVDPPRGANGFGYDPLFEIREYHKTFGELGPAVKRTLSHRSRALRKILPEVLRALG